MFPISDDNPRILTPVVTWTIIGVCTAVFLWQLSLGPNSELAYFGYGMIPARLFGEVDLPEQIATVPAWTTLLTSMFMHGGWLHLGGNMLYLWIFGDNVEDSMGHGRFAAFYILCGVAAALTQAFVDPNSTAPMIGASGAIAGVLGAYILLHPQATVRTLIFFVTIVRIPAVYVLGLWFVVQLWSAATTPADEPGVAFWAHVGGFVAGMVLVFPFRRRGLPLMQPARSRPFEQERIRGPWG
jgi:membrane associated rhomboid family serine protease